MSSTNILHWPLVRLCTLHKQRVDEEYGFTLGVSGHKTTCITAVTTGSIACHVGLSIGDRVIDVNGVAVQRTSPAQVTIQLCFVCNFRQ